MRRLLCLLVLLLSVEARAGSVVVVRRPGVASYERVVEAFLDHCRVPSRLVALDPPSLARLRSMVGRGDIVVAVGQAALDAVAGSGARIIAALAYSTPGGVMRADAALRPDLLLRALRQMRPTVHRVGVVLGRATAELVERAAEAAHGLGMVFVPIQASDGPGAVRELRRVAPTIDALWLTPDLELMTPQLFQYALGLEVRRSLPLLAVSRQQVLSGALLAYDADPYAMGEQAADIVHQILAGEPSAAHSHATLELVVNGEVARRLGVSEETLRSLGARVER